MKIEVKKSRIAIFLFFFLIICFVFFKEYFFNNSLNNMNAYRKLLGLNNFFKLRLYMCMCRFITAGKL